MTIQTALQSIRQELQHTSDAPHLDAERLLLRVLGHHEPQLRSRASLGEAAWLHTHGEEELSAAAGAALAPLVTRRQAGEPLAYILGEWEFYGRPFYVTPDVLIPRPSTEALVEAALTSIRQQGRPMIVADIGTGSGCIVITLALELANFQFSKFNFQIIATDVSPAALVVAQRNAERHGVADRIEFLQGDMLTPLSGRQIDLIVSNPPYIPARELAQAGREAETVGLTYEPRIALSGGSDGEDYIRQIAAAGVPAIVEGVGGHVQTFNLA